MLSSSAPATSRKKYEPIIPKPLFYVSLVVTILGALVIIYRSYNISREFVQYGNVFFPLRLREGWFMGMLQDLTDPQWDSFRQFIPMLLIGAVIFVSISRAIRHFIFPTNVKPILIYNIVFSIGFVYFLYGNCSIFLIAIALFNYGIGKVFKKSKLNDLFSWLFNLSILFTSKYYDGYRFYNFFLPSYLESNRGVLSWETYFNIMFCRLISYNMDYSEQLRKVPSDGISVKKDEEKWSEYRQRQESTLNVEADFNLLHYFAYLFYVPLFVGGPVCGYTAFISYVKYSTQKELSYKQLIWHTIRLISYIVLLEIYLHLFYTVGFNEKGLWKSNSWVGPQASLAPFDVGLWSLWDGINPPENMNRCVNNNYLVSDFWRSWHRSLYLWILKYLYIPLGGSKSKVWSVWIIFTFIALWHDLWWRWLAWAWINCCLIILEAILMFFVFPKIKWIENMRTNRKYMFATLCGFGGAVSIITLVIANLAIMHGFADTPLFIHQLFWQSGGFVFLGVALFYLMFVVMVMIHVRDLEKVKGELFLR
ncbi:hypothetical protein FDP41_005675 [Naegleria fowleri]|uniref:Uncharacterized protein n=1 Tax=Naegleria fowleri TaxID=5763 RepID=A0A6A5BML7_NAEFO|nr:uncharacterized protein FDP41_005675 [Naegleria fowleri]KAF0975304.1 hypothetical protein FDP41_005675 [Naegleria fowleri]